MQWDTLRSFELIARLGSLTAAAKALGVSQSTISRQLQKLEDEAGSPLLFRENPIRLTDRGEALLDAVSPMVDAALAAQSVLDDLPQPEGEVVLTTVGEILRWMLSPQLPSFIRNFPKIQLRFLITNQIVSLAAGDADLSLRMTRPDSGDLFAKRLYSFQYKLFAASTLKLHAHTPWLGLTGSLAEIPEQRAMNKLFASRPPTALVEDIESLGIMVECGTGVALLPEALAERFKGLVEVQPQQVGAKASRPLPARDVWLVTHRSRHKLPKVRAVISWLESVTKKLRA